MTLENRKNPVLDKLSRALLASSCLTGLAGIANANTIIQGVPPAPAEFPTNFPGYLLPLGTTQVIGTLPGCTGCDTEGGQDGWFEFQGLVPSSPFAVSSCCENDASYDIFNSSGSFLGYSDFENGAILNGTVPTDGKLVFLVEDECGDCTNVAPNPYEVTLTDTASAPEPSTVAMAGLALAGALAWRRKRTRTS
jgi:hypothetical protein